MALDDTKTFPTSFALSLLESVDFIKSEKALKQDHLKRNALLEKIASFQKMAIVAPFENCMIVFHGIEILPEQHEMLKIVYESTKPWILGLVVESCVDAIQFKHLGKNEFAEAVKAIVEQTSIKQGKETGKRLQGILVKCVKPEVDA